MEVNLQDSHVVTLVLEYFYSRKLFDSALTLERETGIMVAADASMPEHSKYLRNLCLNGEWDNVMFYLEPFTELDEMSTKRLNFLVLRQKYVEILHCISLNKCCSSDDKEALKKVMTDIRPVSSEDELLQMRALTIANTHRNADSITVARFKCFQEILKVLGPFFGYYENGVRNDDGDQNRNQADQFTRLESVITDSLFLEECCKRCRERAFKMKDDSYLSVLPTLTSSSLESRGTDPSYNAAVLFWILSLNQSDIYRQPYQIEEVKVRTEKIAEPNTMIHKRNSVSSIKIPHLSPSMKTAKSAQHQIPHPVAARSLQMSMPPKSPSLHANLSGSGPMRFSDYTNNGSNTNNNNSIPSCNSKDASPVDFVNHASHELENGVTTSDNSPFVKVNGWTNAILETHDKDSTENRFEEPTSTSEVKEFSISESARTDPDTVDGTPETTISVTEGTSQNPDFLVDSSHEQFLSQQRLLKLQKEEFLRSLEEKEKRNADIRRRLMETAPAVPGMRQDEVDSKSFDSRDSSSIPSNYSPRSPRPFNKLECTQLDYLEDTHAIRTMAFHPSGQVYAVGSNSKTLRICSVPREITTSIGGNGMDINDINNIKKMSPKSAPVIAKRANYHKGSVYCSAWNDEGSLLATGSNDKLVKVVGFDILGKHLDDNPKDILMHRGIVREVAFLYESNNTLASAGIDQMVHISDCKQESSIHNLAGHSGQILGLYSWHHGMLASSSEDKTTRLWDIRTPRCVSIIGVGGSNPAIATSICMDNRGHHLAMGMDCAKVGLYDLRAGKTQVEYKCHNDEIRSVRFNPVFEHLLLSSSYDGSIVITDVQSLLSEIDPTSSHLHHWKRLTESNNKLIQCRWHPNGDAFASTSVDKTCKVYLKIYS